MTDLAVVTPRKKDPSSNSLKMGPRMHSEVVNVKVNQSCSITGLNASDQNPTVIEVAANREFTAVDQLDT